MEKLFISYAIADKDKVYALVEYLEKGGLSCFLAPRDIDPGAAYAEQLLKAIKSSPAVLLIMSKAANASEHLLREVDVTVSVRKPILPIFIENVELRDDFEYYIGRMQWVVAYPDDISTYFEKIYGRVVDLLPDVSAKRERLRREAELKEQQAELERLRAELAAAKAAAPAPAAPAPAAPAPAAPAPAAPAPKAADEHNYVFISYKSQEYDIALKTVEILKENGINCWMAPKSIPAGSDYGSEIPAAIADCAAFVLILSDVAQQSRWIPKEIDAAINADKVIIPFHVDQCPIGASFNFRISNNQRIEAYNRMSQAYGELVERLHAIINKGESK